MYNYLGHIAWERETPGHQRNLERCDARLNNLNERKAIDQEIAPGPVPITL